MNGAGRSELTKAYRAVGAIALSVVVVAAVVIGVRASYGFYNDEMDVTLVLPRAGQTLQEGNFVEYRGVEVGKVHSVSLGNDDVIVRVRLHHGVKVPASVKATVEPLTFFGSKFVDLRDTDGGHGPWLSDGSRITNTGVGDAVETLVGKLTPLLSGIDTRHLTTVLTELEKTVRNGEGARIAKAFDSGVKMAVLFRTTLDAQLDALSALHRFTTAVRDDGPALNAISSNLNQALPVFNEARQKFATLLATLGPFADNLASLLSVNRPDLDRILDEGGNIVRVLTAHQQDLADTVYGLSRYLYTFASGVSADTLPNGQHGAYFKILVDPRNIDNLICGLVAMAPPQLADLRSALFGHQGLIDCTDNIRTVPPAGSGAQATAPPASASAPPTTAAPSGGAAPPSGHGGATSSPTQQLTDEVYGQLAQPNQAEPSGLAALLGSLLGTGS